MKNVEIGIYRLGKSTIDKAEVQRWLGDLGVSEENVSLLSEGRTDAESLVELAGRRCYMSFQPGMNPNITKIRAEIAEYLENILKSGHGSVLEHATYTFAIENVSRVFTGEMNRHRAGWAISEGSMRYIRFEDIPYWIPSSIRGPNPPYDLKDPDHELLFKKYQTRRVFARAFEQAEENYKELCELWEGKLSPKSKFHAKKQITSMMRRIIPMGVASGGIWTGNIRALRHVITMRTSEAAEEEICFVFSNILKMIRDLEPNFFGDFEEVGGFWKPKYIKV